MNQQHNNDRPFAPDESACEKFEVLISAMVDGELEGREHSRLGEHLLKCSGCRQFVREFESVNQVVESLSEIHSQPTRPARRWLTMGRVLPTALATAMAICVLVIVWPNSAPVQATQVPLEQVIEPIESLHEVSLQQERGQQVALEMMELELRLLRVELGSLQPSTASQALAAEIEKMIYRILEQQVDLAMVE